MNNEYLYYMYYVLSNKALYGYAITKEDRDAFVSIRDMENFFYEKRVRLTKEEVHQLAEDHQTGRIQMRKLETYDPKSKSIITVPIALTGSEFISIIGFAEKMLTTELFIDAWIPLDLMCKNIRKNLMFLGYDCFNSFITPKGKATALHSDVEVELKQKYVEKMIGSLRADYVAIFLKLYGQTIQ